MEKKIKSLKVYGDSALVICQLNGEWETRDSKLVPYQEFIKKLIEIGRASCRERVCT